MAVFRLLDQEQARTSSSLHAECRKHRWAEAAGGLTSNFMTTTQQIEETREIIDGVLNRWAPFPDDPFEHRMIRALLNISAFEKDFERVRRGETPIRTDYPIPFPTEQKAPTGGG